jgi:hypothetical protein
MRVVAGVDNRSEGELTVTTIRSVDARLLGFVAVVT